MITLITANWLLYLIALLIGVVTAFWVWAATGREASAVDRFSADDGLLEKAGEPVRPADPQPESSPPADAVGEPDNLRLIKGVGPKLNTLLNGLGVTRFDQIADWKEAEITEVDQYLETFSGRITRDAWIDQAKFLAKDDIAGFEKKYGKL